LGKTFFVGASTRFKLKTAGTLFYCVASLRHIKRCGNAILKSWQVRSTSDAADGDRTAQHRPNIGVAPGGDLPGKRGVMTESLCLLRKWLDLLFNSFNN